MTRRYEPETWLHVDESPFGGWTWYLGEFRGDDGWALGDIATGYTARAFDATAVAAEHGYQVESGDRRSGWKLAAIAAEEAKEAADAR